MPDVDTPFALDRERIAFFETHGFVKLDGVFEAETLRHFGPAFTADVRRQNADPKPMAERSTYEKAFVQVMNLWARNEQVRQFVFGKRLARIAAELLGVRGVRLYHDQALYKEAGGGHTPWHADQYYWPLASDRCCTAWIPLQDTPLEMGPVAFAPGSQRLAIGRDLGISDESEASVAEALKRAKLATFEEAFRIGEVSFHAGWTFHRAGANRTDRCREAMTVIYMDVDMRLSAPANPNQMVDHETWCPGAVVGERIETPLNPVLYETETATSRSSGT